MIAFCLVLCVTEDYVYLDVFLLSRRAFQVWTGDVLDVGTTAENEGAPRTISMAWGEVCDVEVLSTPPAAT